MKWGAVVGGQKFFCQHFLTPKRSGLSASAAWHQKLKQKTKIKLVTTNGEYMGKKRERRENGRKWELPMRVEINQQ